MIDVKIISKIKKLLYILREYEIFYRFRKSRYSFKKEHLKNLSKMNNISIYKLCIDYMFASYINGCMINDYILGDFYKLNNTGRKKYITTRKNGKLETVFNKNVSKLERNIFNNKVEFNKVFKKYIKRRSIFCKNEKDIIKFISSVDKFIIKPLNLYGGKGIEIIEAKNIIDKSQFAKKLINEKYIIEECLEQCEDMKILNSTSINTVRPFLIRTKTGEIKIISCIVRIGRKGAMIDNISTGGIMCPVDIKSGMISGSGSDLYGNKYLYSDSGIYLPGFQVPKWKLIVENIIEAMSVIKSVNWVSFDICVTNEGIEFIEGNIDPGANSYQADGPKLDVLKKYWSEFKNEK